MAKAMQIPSGLVLAGKSSLVDLKMRKQASEMLEKLNNNPLKIENEQRSPKKRID